MWVDALLILTDSCFSCTDGLLVCVLLCVGRNFVVTGLKSDYTTKHALPFVTDSHGDADTRARDELRAHEASDKLRSLFLNYVLPKVNKYFGSLFEHVRDWQKQFDIVLWADIVTATGSAECYWPRSHVDNDAWYTILLVLDLGTGLEAGGDFSLSLDGYVFKMEHLDICFFNPWRYHSCTEPRPRVGGSRLFMSFYCKKDTVSAAALTSAMHARVGNAPLSLCRMR